MFIYILSKLVTMFVGMLYPAYCSCKAVKNKDVREYVQWMMYWIVFALYSFCEIFSDALIGIWFPFYYELKILFLIWLASPLSQGGSVIYRRFVHPKLLQYEPDIDMHLAGMKSRTSRVFFEYAGKLIGTVTEAVTERILNTALRARAGEYQLQVRRTYSLNDLCHDEPGRVEENALTTRSAINSPTDDVDLSGYFSERMAADFTQASRVTEVLTEEEMELDATALVEVPLTEVKKKSRGTRRKKETQPVDSAYNTLPRTRRTRKSVKVDSDP